MRLNGKKVGPRLRELAPAVKGDRDAEVTQGPPFLSIPVYGQISSSRQRVPSSLRPTFLFTFTILHFMWQHTHTPSAHTNARACLGITDDLTVASDQLVKLNFSLPCCGRSRATSA